MTDTAATRDTDLVYFFHIPKTSGTSLHAFLLQTAGANDPESVSPQLLWDHLVTGSYQVSEKTKVISGHFGGLLPLWLGRWPRILTILRDPVARALSHINHVQRLADHPLHAVAAGLSITQYCENPILRKTVENFQARYLASMGFSLALMPKPEAPWSLPEIESGLSQVFGEISVQFEEALFALDRKSGLRDFALRAIDTMDAVGICEAHGASLELFAKILGWEGEVIETRSNTASEQQRTVSTLTRAEVAALEGLTEIDRAVYRHACRRFQVLCDQYGVASELSATLAAQNAATSGNSGSLPNVTRLWETATDRLRSVFSSSGKVF